MSASGYTPILIYGSVTSGNTPSASNLTTGATGVELAINAYDGKLFYKDASGNVQVLASKAGNVNVASLSFGTTGLTPNTATTGAITVAGTLITSNGGTGLASYTAGDLPYYASGTALSKLAIGTNGQILTSSGTAPQWSTLSGVAVTTFSGGTTGLTPSSATSGAITLAGTLAVGNGGTGLTSFTVNGVPYASSSSVLTTGSGLLFDGNNLAVSGAGLIGTGTATSGAKLTLGNDSSGSATIKLSLTTATTERAFVSIAGGTGELKISAGYAGYGGFTTFYTNGSEAMRLTSAGYLGIGTSSPSALLHTYGTTGTISNYIENTSASGYTELTLKNTGSSGHTYSIGVGGNSASTGYANNLYFYDGTNSAIRMTLDSSGNLGLGVTPSAWSGSWKAIDVNGVALASDGSAGVHVSSNAYWNGSSWIYKTSAAAEDYYQSSGTHVWRYAPSGTAGNAISFTQAMTLDNSGNLLVGTTGLPVSNGKLSVSGQSRFYQSAGDGAAALAIDKSSTTNTTSQVFAFFTINNQNTGSGQINANGASQVAFGSFSDLRLKENIVELPSQLNNILALKPSEFDYKDGSGHQIGFIAQDMQKIYPDAVSEREDGMLIITGWSKTEARLVKAIQELSEEVNQLKQKLGV
jgi:hypothetical protein